MAKSAMIRARTEADLKHEVEEIFKEPGLTTTEAINIFYNQVRLNRGLPFEIKIPNETTVKTFQDTDKDKNLVHFEDMDDMFLKLGI